MILRTSPSAKTMNHLVHLRNNGADVAEIGLHLASAQILRQGGLKFSLMRLDGIPKLFELLDSPFYRKGGAGAEELRWASTMARILPSVNSTASSVAAGVTVSRTSLIWFSGMVMGEE